MKISFWTLSFFVLFILTLPDLGTADTQGILVSPQRVILEGRSRTAQINMVNPGDQPRQFRIDLIHMAMDSQGRLRKIQEPTAAQKEIEKMVRFSPRRTFLNPGQSQTIRLMSRRPANTADGEYRLHLSLAPIPIPASDKPEKIKNAPEQTAFDIKLLIGITLPVFIRYGELRADVEASGLELVKNRDKSFVNIDLSRTGSRSVSTDVDIFLLSQNSETEEKIGIVAGAAVYYPNALRTVKIPLSVPAGFNFSGSQLKAVIRDHEVKGNPVLSSRIFSLPSQ